MPSFRDLARAVRHSPPFERADWLWDLLRKPYHRVLERDGRGAPLVLGGKHRVYLPAAMAGNDWETYECEAARMYGDWIVANPTAVVLDVGCAWGMYTVLALGASPRSEVFAFDGDLPSLAATLAAASRSSPAGRLHLVHGLVSDASTENRSLEILCKDTQRLIQGVSTKTLSYVCIGDRESNSIPLLQLDRLFVKTDPQRPMLLKLDIEGAELLALRGAQRLLERSQTTVLVSVHPQLLPRYGSTSGEVRAFLESYGYQLRTLAIDHEEHWWCQRGADAVESSH